MPYKKESEPVIRPSRRKGTEAVAVFLASLIEPAPLTLLCMACRTPRCATAGRIVLWHPDVIDPAHECAGAGAPGLELDGAHRG